MRRVCGVLAAGAPRECSARPGEEIEEQRVRHARTLLVQLRARIIAPTLAPLRLRAFVAQSTAAQLRRRARRGRHVRRAIASLPHERVDTAWDMAGRSRRRVLYRAATDGRRVRSAPGVRPEPCGCRVCTAPAAGKCVRSATTARDRPASTRCEPFLGARRSTVHRRGVGPGHVICRPALRRAVPPPFPHAPPARARDTGGEARALTGRGTHYSAGARDALLAARALLAATPGPALQRLRAPLPVDHLRVARGRPARERPVHLAWAVATTTTPVSARRAPLAATVARGRAR